MADDESILHRWRWANGRPGGRGGNNNGERRRGCLHADDEPPLFVPLNIIIVLSIVVVKDDSPVKVCIMGQIAEFDCAINIVIAGLQIPFTKVKVDGFHTCNCPVYLDTSFGFDLGLTELNIYMRRRQWRRGGARRRRRHRRQRGGGRQSCAEFWLLDRQAVHRLTCGIGGPTTAGVRCIRRGLWIAGLRCAWILRVIRLCRPWILQIIRLACPLSLRG